MKSVLNIPLLRKVMEHIEAHPDEWDQEAWAARTPCGTTYCFAGIAVVMSGHDLMWTPGYMKSHWVEQDVSTTRGEHIQEVAMRELGLSLDQASAIFGAIWVETPNEMRDVVERAIGARL